jgi:hypothetical protein
MEAWQGTYTTLHLWTQIVGKIRLALSPLENHWWQVPLYTTVWGLTTSPMSSGSRIVQIDFDFFDHVLRIESNSGETRPFPLEGLSVAGFYRQVMKMLAELGVDVQIWPVPVEVEERILQQDEQHATINPRPLRFWQVLPVSQVMKVFQPVSPASQPGPVLLGRFRPGNDPVHGKRAPLIDHAYQVALYVMQEAEFLRTARGLPGEGLRSGSRLSLSRA